MKSVKKNANCGALKRYSRVGFLSNYSLRKLFMSQKILNVSDKAPSFSLLSQEGETVTLEQFRGTRVLLYFYPKAMTPGCTVQACELRDQKDAFKKLNVTILGISIDSVSRLEKFAEKEKLNFTLLSDEDHKVCEAYGVWGTKKMMGRVYDGIHRASFLIDEKGIISHVFFPVNTKTHHADVLSVLA
jgi:peroxiredoxin Q/BCP